MEEFIKKLKLALQDKDTAEGLKAFGIEPEQLDGLNDITTPATLDEALKLKGIQSEYDKRLAKAANTREENLKSKFDFKAKEQEEEEEVKTDDPALKLILKEFNALKEKMAQQEAEKVKETQAQKLTRLTEDLKSKGIPAIYAKEFNLEEDLEAQFETVKKQFETDFGTIAKPAGTKLPFPKKPETKNEPSKQEVEEFNKYI